jgi:hypothetical protein
MWHSDYEPEGYEYIRFTGSISTLEPEDEFWERDRLPFGFRAPEVRPIIDVPEMPSEAWGEWLET